MTSRNLFGAWIFLLLCGPDMVHAASVKLGIDMLQEDGFAVLQDKKAGLVLHPASVNSRGTSTMDVLRQTDRCKLAAIFGPEHGVYGDEYAGAPVGDRTDKRTGLMVRSLYGKTRKPTPEMLRGLDALVFDLQDIGSRSYTYISTMKLCLEACAEADIEFVVLDRPNPLGGERVEGPLVEKGFESFISALPVPYLHGMTMGELARMMREEIAPNYQKLQVVKMTGWKRAMLWNDTGLGWTPTSPHIPHASTCAFYAATGILGELGQISNGVGYTQPFELIGAPWIRAEALAEALSARWQDPGAYKTILDGGSFTTPSSPCPMAFQFRPARFKSFYALFKDMGCGGVQILLSPKEAGSLLELNFRVLCALDAPKLFRQAEASQIAMFDKACGADEPRKWLMEGRNLNELFEKWQGACDRFRESRQKFLLYD